MTRIRLYTLTVLAVMTFGCQDESARSQDVIVVSEPDAAQSDGQVPQADTGTNTYDGMVVHDAEPDMGQIDADVEPDVMPAVIPGQCVDGEAFQAGTAVFVERTNEWKLDRADARGNRITLTDIDGDGYADLIVRRSGVGADVLDLGDRPIRRHWVLKNRGDAFQDITFETGIFTPRGAYPFEIGRPVEVVVAGDVDNDGDVDIYSGVDTRSPVEIDAADTTVQIRETSELLLNDGEGRFELAPANLTLRRAGQEDVPTGASWLDFDLDGSLDLWVSQGGLGTPAQDQLYRGDGQGGFTAVTGEVGLTTQPWMVLADLNAARGHTTAWSAVACDLNRDGRPELLAGSYGRAPNHLWQAVHNNDGTSYVNRSVESGYAFDDDQSWQDNQFARCFCQSQRDAPNCADVPAPLIRCNQQNWRHQFDQEAFRNGGNSGATVCADFNNDGWMDLYTTEIRHWWAGMGSDASEVLVNQGGEDVVFERPGRDATGLALSHDSPNWDEGHITAGAFDFDNDGRLDLYVGGTDYPGNRGRLYRNVSEAGEVRFSEMTTAEFFEHNRSHGMAISDFDRDGDLDIVVGHSRNRCNAQAPNNCYETATIRYFENQFGSRNNWLQLHLVGGQGTNKGAIGATVTVVTDTLEQTQQRLGGYGHYGAQSDNVLHFGLGQSCTATITIEWPDSARTVQRLQLNAGHRYRVVQGQAAELVDAQ